METKLSREAATSGSIAMKVAWLKQLCFAHNSMRQVSEAVTRLMTPGTEGTITLVVGPTGVGKSTLGRRLLAQFLQQHIAEIHENRGCIPAILAEVPPASGGKFDWPLFYREIGDKLLVPRWDEAILTKPGPMLTAPETVFDKLPSMRFAATRALKRRKTRHIILDECVHFTDSDEEPLEYGNLLKSLANVPGTNLLMLGAYGSEALVKASAQLSRRVSVVHFPRYPATPQGRKEYGVFLFSLQSSLPLPYDVNLMQFRDVLAAGTCSLPGFTADVVCQTVVNAATDMQTSGVSTWKDEYLFSAMPSAVQHATILADCLDGEERIRKYLPSLTKPEYVSEDDVRNELQKKRDESFSLREF
jgi:hypothetical protein